MNDRCLKKYKPTTYFLAYTLTGLIIDLFWPNLRVIDAPFRYFGLPLMILGLGLVFWVDLVLKQEKTTVKPTDRF